MTRERPVAIVTGARGGIGLEIATRVERDGYDVFAVDLAPPREPASAPFESVRPDVTDEPGAHALVERIRAAKGRIDLLVNDAAIFQPGTVEWVPVDLARHQLELNVFGHVRFLQAVLPLMRSRRAGRTINVTSASGKVSVPGLGWYAASKHAIEALSDALRDEVRPFGIHVVVIEPGVLRTPLIERQNERLAKVPHPEARPASASPVATSRPTRPLAPVMTIMRSSFLSHRCSKRRHGRCRTGSAPRWVRWSRALSASHL